MKNIAFALLGALVTLAAIGLSSASTPACHLLRHGINNSFAYNFRGDPHIQ